MENLELIFTNWSDVMLEDKLVERSLENNENDAQTHLDDGCCKHVTISNNRKMNPILEISYR